MREARWFQEMVRGETMVRREPHLAGGKPVAYPFPRRWRNVEISTYGHLRARNARGAPGSMGSLKLPARNGFAPGLPHLMYETREDECDHDCADLLTATGVFGLCSWWSKRACACRASQRASPPPPPASPCCARTVRPLTRLTLCQRWCCCYWWPPSSAVWGGLLMHSFATMECALAWLWLCRCSNNHSICFFHRFLSLMWKSTLYLIQWMHPTI